MSPRLAYLCLQATTEGQASYAHVHEIITGLEGLGWNIDLYQPGYVGGTAPGVAGRLAEFSRVQKRLIARLGEYDTVYVRAHPLAYTASRAARAAGRPVIQECNGPYDDLFIAWPAARFAKRWLIAHQREQYRDADALIAVTPQLAEWLTEQTGGHAAAVVPNGANTELFSPDAPRPEGLPKTYAVFFGALAPWQGISTALAALESPEWPDGVALVVAGDGMEREAVEHSAATYLGPVGYREIPGLVAGAVASLIPKSASVHEASGLAPLKLFESMACGVPVVVSAVGGMDKLVEATACGLSVPPGDAAALARAVAALSSDPQTAAEMGQRGREAAVAEHSWAARAADTDRVIRAAIGRARSHRAGGVS